MVEHLGTSLTTLTNERKMMANSLTITTMEGKTALVIVFDNEAEMQSLRMLCRSNTEEEGYMPLLNEIYPQWSRFDQQASPKELHEVFTSVFKTLEKLRTK